MTEFSDDSITFDSITSVVFDKGNGQHRNHEYEQNCEFGQQQRGGRSGLKKPTAKAGKNCQKDNQTIQQPSSFDKYTSQAGKYC